ncbi:MAG: hypothetical protein K2X08_00710, partial [Chlamydiales bacterium]|nr:hypothetical protein [Chlamydiales bacterium]
NAQANWGSTPLMIAIDNKNRRQVKELLAGGADLSIRDKQGRDARRRAIEAMWLEELNEILVSLGRTPLLIPMQQRAVSTETADTSKDTEDNAWGLQYGAVLASTVITVFTLAYYTYRKRQEPQPLIQSAPVVRPRKKAVVVASDREIVPAQPVDGRDVEALRKKITFSLEAVKSYFEPEIRETYQQQQFEISIKQTRILNTMARLREKARSRGMRSRYEDLFVRIDKDITLLVDFSDAISEALSEQHQEAYERLMVDMQNPELRYELLEVLCEQVKILSQKIEEEKDFFLEKQACAQKASNRIDRNLDYLELQIAAPEAKNEQAFFKQQQEESQHKAEQEQRALNKKKWQEEKRQRKLSKMEEMKKNKDKEVVSAKKTDKGKQRAMKESRKGEVYLRALGSDVDLLENILDPAKINLYLSDPKLVISCQFYGSCYYVMRIFHRISKMYKFGLGDYAPCSADEAMKMRNAIMHQHESWFSNPGTIISIAGEVMHKLKHTLDALLKAEPAQQMTISIDFPQNVRYSKIKVLDKIYEDYLKVVEEARHLVLNGKYDISQPFHGILKAFNFMLGQILKDFDIQDNPFLAHRDRIGHRFDIVSGEEEDQSLSEEINRWALFELCKPEAMQTLAALVNECQHRAGVNLPPGAQSAASSSSSGHNFPWFFGEQDESGLSIIHGNSSMAPHH